MMMMQMSKDTPGELAALTVELEAARLGCAEEAAPSQGEGQCSSGGRMQCQWPALVEDLGPAETFKL